MDGGGVNSSGSRSAPVGCIPALVWEQSDGESVPAVAGVVYRLWARRSAGARPGRKVASVGWACEGRHKAGTCEDLMGLAGRGRARHLRIGTCYEYRHQVGEACCRKGGVAGAEPPHKGGPNRPDRPKLQGPGVRGQRRRLFWRKLEWELTVAWLPQELGDCSPQFWDAALRSARQSRGVPPCYTDTGGPRWPATTRL